MRMYVCMRVSEINKYKEKEEEYNRYEVENFLLR